MVDINNLPEGTPVWVTITLILVFASLMVVRQLKDLKGPVGALSRWWEGKAVREIQKKKTLALDDQFILYTWALRKLGVPIHGIVRSDARTQRNKGDMGLDQRFQRVTTYCSDLEADNVAADALLTAQAAHMPGRPVYPSPTPDRCNWRCPFTEPCIARRKGLGTVVQLMSDFGLTQVQEKHREYAADPVATLIESGELRLETEETA